MTVLFTDLFANSDYTEITEHNNDYAPLVSGNSALIMSEACHPNHANTEIIIFNTGVTCPNDIYVSAVLISTQSGSCVGVAARANNLIGGYAYYCDILTSYLSRILSDGTWVYLGQCDTPSNGTVIKLSCIGDSIGCYNDASLDITVADSVYASGSAGFSGYGTGSTALIDNLTFSDVPDANRQYAYRFRNDDGSESTATWLAAEDTPINLSVSQRIRLRIGVNFIIGVGLTHIFKLKVQKRISTDPDVWSTVEDVK